METERQRLVTQLRRAGIEAAAVLGAIERTPRKNFIRPGLQADAYLGGVRFVPLVEGEPPGASFADAGASMR